MAYLSTITNEQTAELPSARFDGEILVVEREEQVGEVCRILASHKVIGFDTETRPSFKAGVTNRVALLQLSTPKQCFLIRLCRMKLHKEILRILSNPRIHKIGADVAGDLRALHQLRNFTERGFIDLQQIAPDWGIEEKSLRKLSAIVLNERVSKAQRLSNWEASTLTPQQQMYAATDAWVCIKIYEKLLRSPRIKASQTADTEQKAQDNELKDVKQNNDTKHVAKLHISLSLHKRAHNNNKSENKEKSRQSSKRHNSPYHKRLKRRNFRKTDDNNENQL